ncbi:MAG: M16 family metallopeptidase [Candidatus Zixiibacteriota bacterium]
MTTRTRTSHEGIYHKTVLSNGLRIVTETIPSVRSVTIGIWVDVGSRHEQAKLNGVTHFIEHMAFKGTKRRTAKQIAAELESHGGSLNAFTSREHTCFAARVLDDHLNIAVDVLADITCNATLTPLNIKREKMVICEEIKEMLENPSDHIHDLFARTFWGTHPLGQPILGTKESVTGIQRNSIVDYWKNHYRAGSVVVAAAGRVSHNRLVQLVRQKLDFPDGKTEQPEKAYRPQEQRMKLAANNNSQTHLCLGYPGVEYNSKLKMAVLALNTYLGGGMSSVLFQKIREEQGLAYATYTFHDFYRDAGVFGAYLGTDKKHLQQAVDIILTELERVRKRRIPDAKLDAIKSQMKGSLALGMESTTSRMNRLARHELMLGDYEPYRKTLRVIDKITSSEILEVANYVFDNSTMAIAVLGPADKKDIDNLF